MEQNKKQKEDSTIDIQKIIKEFEACKQTKQSWNNKYDEIMEYLMPFKYNINHKDDKNSKDYQEKNANIISSIGANSANNFVNKMQQIITPVNTDFLGLEFADYIDNKEEKDKELEKLAKLLNAFKNASNFDAIMPQFYYDLIAGTACLVVQGNGFREPLIFNAIPFKDYCIHEGFNGNPDGIYREITIQEKEIEFIWSDAKYEIKNKKEDKSVNLLEVVKYNYKNNNFDYLIIDNNTKKDRSIIVRRTYKTNPFIVLRWNKVNGEIYGRGVGTVAIPEVKTLNKIIDYALRALAFAIPTYMYKDDGMIDPDTLVLEPGAMIPVPDNDTRNPYITPVNTSSNLNFDITQYNISSMEMRIKRIMLDNTIPDDSNVRSATEVNQRVAELNVNLTSMFGRLLTEFLKPLTKRIIEVLQTFGYIPPDFDLSRIDNYTIKVKIKTALALQANQEELTKTINAMQILGSFDPTGALISKTIKLANILPYMLRLAGVPSEFINSKEETGQKETEIAQNQRNAEVQNMQDNVDVSNAIEEGKVNAKKDLQ